MLMLCNPDMASYWDLFRDRISCWLSFSSIILIALSILLIILAMLFGMRDHMIPDIWGTYEGNHGPWRHYHPGGELIWVSINMLTLVNVTMLL